MSTLTEADKKHIIRELEVIQTKIWINKTMSKVAGFAFAVVCGVIGYFAGHDYYRDKTERQLISFGYGTYDQEGKFKWTHPNVPPAAKP